jgi:hypothetical protein
MTTLQQRVETAIARRNVDQRSDGSLWLPNGKPVTPESVTQCIRNVYEQPYGIHWRIEQLRTLLALPADVGVNELRRHLVADTRCTRLPEALRQEEYQLWESLRYVRDMERALEYVTQEI